MARCVLRALVTMRTLLSLTASLAVASFTFFAARSASAQPCSTEDSRELCRPRDIFFMPGVTGVTYLPNASKVHPFVGAGVHWPPFQWSHNTESFGPSQGALFFQASLLRSPSSKGTLALIEGGTTLSFERNSSRR